MDEWYAKFAASPCLCPGEHHQMHPGLADIAEDIALLPEVKDEISQLETRFLHGIANDGGGGTGLQGREEMCTYLFKGAFENQGQLEWLLRSAPLVRKKASITGYAVMLG